MDSEKTVTSIRLNNDSVVFLVLEWEKDKKLNLKVLNIEEKEAYEGQVTETDLRSQAAKIRMSFSDFMLKTRDALFKNSSNQTNYLYSLDQASQNYVFKWKSIDSEETIISLGSLEMEKINFYSFLTQFLFSFADEMQSMKSCIENLNSELNACKSQLSTALTNLSSAIDLKKGMEKELYSKFILLLNEKKRKIKELENNHSFSAPIIKKKKMAPTKRIASSDKSDMELERISNTSSRLNLKKNPPTKMIASSDESDMELESISNASSCLNVKTKNSLAKRIASIDESDMVLESISNASSRLNVKMKNPRTKKLAFSDESDMELESISNTSSCLNVKKQNPSTNTVDSYESNQKLDNISNTSSQVNIKKKNHFLNMLVSSSESDVDGEFHNEDPGPSNRSLNNSLQFDDETKPVPKTEIRKRKVGPQKNPIPDLSSHSADKDNLSDDGSGDSLLDLL